MVPTIYALKGSTDWCDIMLELKQGIGRFGWSYIPTADLRVLKKKIESDGWDSLTDDEKDCYQPFLLDFRPGDYVIYINVPEWGKCTVAKVTSEYQWKFEDKDFNHRFSVDPASIYVFNRNDAFVHPALSSRLKLQGRWWRIYLQDEFNNLLKSLGKGTKSIQRSPQANLGFLSSEIQPLLLGITQHIHHTHPNYDLEGLLAEIFKNVPGVTDVYWQGGAGDHGADLLVNFDEGLSIPGLEKKSTLVVQAKSYEGNHWDTKAINDIKRAFEHYPQASMGLIVSTADSITASVENELDKLREDSGKPVALLVGADVASFVLKYGKKLLS